MTPEQQTTETYRELERRLAYGPKPWSDYVKKCARNAWVRELGPDEDIHDLW
jgi:hypothetical protein